MIQLAIRIAQEKVGCDFNYEAGSKLLSDCIPGITKDLINRLLKGTHSAEYIDDTSSINIIDKENKDSLNISNLIRIKIDSIFSCYNNDYLTNLRDCLSLFEDNILKIDLKTYLKIKEEGIQDVLEDNCDCIRQYEYFEKFINGDLITLYNIKSVIEELYSDDKILLKDVENIRLFILEIQQSLYTGFLPRFNTNIEKFIKNKIELDKLLYIKPTNEYCITGWFSPTGDYYGLNGEIGNFLHIRIADLLKQSKIISDIPKNQTPENYLENQGWIKQQKNLLLYYRYYKNKSITEEQKKAIKRILSQVYSFIDLQTKGNEIPIRRITEIDDIQLRKHFS